MSDAVATSEPGPNDQIVVPDGHVLFAIDPSLAQLALIAADGMRRLSGHELMKLQAIMNVSSKMKKPTAKTVGDLCRLIGFTFAMGLNDAREKRIQEEKEQANASDDTEAS